MMPLPKKYKEESGAGKGGRLFAKRARTSIFLIVAVALVGLIGIPLFLSGSNGANAVYVAAKAGEKEPGATPVPFVLTTPVPTPDPDALETPVPEATMQISQYVQLQENDDYPTVRQLQERLIELGYMDADEPSTVYGHATTVAVSLFQRTLNYDMNGVADSELQEHLFSDQATPYEIKLGDTGTDVESMQSRLHELGYYEGKVNGCFGVATEEALTSFETKNELTVNSIFNVADRDLLYSPAAKPKIDPTPTPTPKPTKKPSSGSTRTSAPTSGGSSSGSSGSSAPSAPSQETSSQGGSYSASYSGSGLVSVASAMVGVQYAWSEESPSKGFDCSGLVYFCLRTCGVRTSRYSAAGFSSVGSWGYIGSPSELSTGDLVFFKSDSSDSVNHTGIYSGGGRFVHASSSSGKVIVSNIGTAYWTRNFVNGRRVF